MDANIRVKTRNESQEKQKRSKPLSEAGRLWDATSGPFEGRPAIRIDIYIEPSKDLQEIVELAAVVLQKKI